MKSKVMLMAVLAGSLILASCTKYPNESDRTLEDLVVVTQYDTKANFSEYTTFAIPDSISVITETDSGRIQNATTDVVVNQIVQNMVARGYTRVATNQAPDLGINVSFFKNTNIQVYYPGWYWGYPGYYPPDYWYGGGYGYYYPYYPTVTSYTVGSLIVDMVDLKNANPITQEISICWTAYIRGLLTGYHTTGEITTSIDQAFVQTPQLTK